MKTMKRIYKSIPRGQFWASISMLIITLCLHGLMLDDYKRGFWALDRELVLWSVIVCYTFIAITTAFVTLTVLDAKQNYIWIMEKEEADWLERSFHTVDFEGDPHARQRFNGNGWHRYNDLVDLKDGK